MKEYATHVWTPAIDTPTISGYFRRAYYKQKESQWFALNIHNEWVPSMNDSEWFDTETKEGYFVSMKEFNNPSFVSKPEAL